MVLVVLKRDSPHFQKALCADIVSWSKYREPRVSGHTRRLWDSSTSPLLSLTLIQCPMRGSCCDLRLFTERFQRRLSQSRNRWISWGLQTWEWLGFVCSWQQNEYCQVEEGEWESCCSTWVHSMPLNYQFKFNFFFCQCLKMGESGYNSFQWLNNASFVLILSCFVPVLVQLNK